MTQNYGDWLPFDALTSAAIISVFEPIVNDWSKRWFGSRPFDVVSIRPQACLLSLKETKVEWVSFGQGIFIAWSKATQLAVAAHGLDVTSIPTKYAPDDKSLMIQFSYRIAQNLAEALVDAIGTDIECSSTHPFDSGGGIELKLQSTSNGTMFMVGVSAAALTQLRKKQCSRYVPDKLQTASLADILGPAVVGYKVELGGAIMSVLELQTMEKGDIVVLDRPLAVPLEVLEETSRSRLFSAMLGQHEGQLALTACEFEGSKT